MTPDEQTRAWEILHRHEEVAAQQSTLHDGAHELLTFLRARRIKTAIATRNSRRSTQTVLTRHNLIVDFIHTRDDGPVKPSPQPVWDICKHFNIPPEFAWVVGDYLFDLLSARSAGATPILMLGNRLHHEVEYTSQADLVITSLRELTDRIADDKLI